MKTLKFSPLFSFLMLYFMASVATAQTNAPTIAKSDVEIIQFHSEHRCVTCLKIEELTKETVKSFTGMPFKLVNIDDTKNEKIAEKFEAAGTALFIYNPKTGKKKDMTDFAFMNSGDKAKFMAGLKKEINQF
jgi:Skp family chaperone for outer membrane proteins